MISTPGWPARAPGVRHRDRSSLQRQPPFDFSTLGPGGWFSATTPSQRLPPGGERLPGPDGCRRHETPSAIAA
jgi:hypothetical protein